MPDWMKKASRSSARSLGSGDCLDNGESDCLEGLKIVRWSEFSLDGVTEYTNEVKRRAETYQVTGDGGALTRWNFGPLVNWLRAERSCRQSVMRRASDLRNDLEYWVEGCPRRFTRRMTLSSRARCTRLLESCDRMPVALNGDLTNI